MKLSRSGPAALPAVLITGDSLGHGEANAAGRATMPAPVAITSQDRDRSHVRRFGESHTDGVGEWSANVYDLWRPKQNTSRLALVVPAHHALETALSALMDSLATILGVSGIAVAVAQEDGQLHLVTAVGQACRELERTQENVQAGPGRDAYDTGEVVRITDVRWEPGRWPEFSAAANRLHVSGLAGIPMRLADTTVGALNLYSSQPRKWSDEDLAVAKVIADVATAFVVNLAKLGEQETLSARLQGALTSRIVIEQAKGMTAAHYSVTFDQAYQLIRRYARNHNLGLRMVAEAIVARGPSCLIPKADTHGRGLRWPIAQTPSMPSLTAEPLALIPS